MSEKLSFVVELKRRNVYTHGLRRRKHYAFRFADTLGMGSASERSAVSKNPGRSGAEDDPLIKGAGLTSDRMSNVESDPPLSPCASSFAARGSPNNCYCT